MAWLPESQDHLPLTWWKGRPVYLAAFLALGGLASMVLTALLMAGSDGMLGALMFDYDAFWHRLRFWTAATHILVNPPSIWLVLTTYLLWRFGEDVERFFGRRAFVRLVVCLVLLGPVVLSVLGLIADVRRSWAGFGQLELGVFLAFAALYPRAQISIIILTLEVWILAAVFVGVSTLADVAGRDWVSLVLLWSHVGMAVGWVRFEQGRWTLPALSSLRRKLAAPSSRGSARKSGRVPKSKVDDDTLAGLSHDVDAILDKISRDGMQSLSEDERRALDKASEVLAKRRGDSRRQ